MTERSVIRPECSHSEYANRAQIGGGGGEQAVLPAVGPASSPAALLLTDGRSYKGGNRCKKLKIDV